MSEFGKKVYKFADSEIPGKAIMYSILCYTIIMETLISQFHFPTEIRYFNDFLVLLLIPLILKDGVGDFFRKNGNQAVVISVLVFLCISLFTSLINVVSPLLVLWALRNTFRGVVFFFAASLYIKKEDLPKLFDILLVVQAVNLLLAIYQYAVLHRDRDDIGGIFGYSNAAVNLFNILITAYFFVCYLKKKEGFLKLVIACLSSVLMASLAEVKASFIFIVLISIVVILLTGFSVKKLLIVVGIICVLITGILLMEVLNPESAHHLKSLKAIIEYFTASYESGYRLPRLGSFSIIEKLFLNDSIFSKLFGIGFGNAETSKFSFLQSEFYLKYGDYNYRWFTHQWIFIEEGYIGFISYLSIFISMLICLVKNRKYDVDNYNIIVAICTVICCIAIIWYDAALKIDMQYLAYFSMAIGFVSLKNQNIVYLQHKLLRNGCKKAK